MSQNEMREHYIGNVCKGSRTYYTYRSAYGNGSDVWIRDDENGERTVGFMRGEPKSQEIFDYLYEDDAEFKEYVDTDGKCLYDVKISTKYTEKGEVTTIVVPYVSRSGICLPKSCGDCPMGYQMDENWSCGRNELLTEADFVRRPETCKLREVNLSGIQGNIHAQKCYPIIQIGLNILHDYNVTRQYLNDMNVK